MPVFCRKFPPPRSSPGLAFRPTRAATPAYPGVGCVSSLTPIGWNLVAFVLVIHGLPDCTLEASADKKANEAKPHHPTFQEAS